MNNGKDYSFFEGKIEFIQKKVLYKQWEKNQGSLL